jgi:superkiller protein 3
VIALTLRTIERGHDWLNDINLFQSAISIHPSNAKAYALLGDQYMKLQTKEGREQALAQYETAIHLYPDYATTHAGFASNLGKTLFELGRTHEAIDALQQGISANPRWSLLHYNLALMYAKSGQYTRADQAWRQALALNPDDPQVGSTYSRFLIERGLYEEGLSQAQMILQRHPDFVLAVYNRALALQSLGRVREAIEGYERVLALPNSPDEAKADVMRKLQTLRLQLGSGSSSVPPCPLGLTAC